MILIKLPPLLVIAVAIFSCKENKTNPKIQTRRVLIDDVIAEGDISSDTIYNGLIKFYDTATNQLISETFYKNGKINGKRKDYYLSGGIKNIGYYENGRQIETASHFDSSGQLTLKQDFYYDLRVGNNVEYTDGKPTKYYFISFDNEELFYLNYDSIQTKNVRTLNNYHFFFFHSDSVTTISISGKESADKDYFIYIINPPDFNFEYSLVIINDRDSILKVEKRFNQAKIWDTFTFNQSKLKTGERYSLALKFDLTLIGRKKEEVLMFKRL